MKKLFLDCEYDGFMGHLISMALVGENNEKFYEVVRYGVDPWVKINVLPVLNKEAVGMKLFQGKLEGFLRSFPEGFCVVVDWPEDILHFCSSIILSPGKMMDLPNFEILMDRRLSSKDSAIPHNALEDAKAMMKVYLMLPKRLKILQDN